MSNHTKSSVQQTHLRSGLMYLALWLVVLIEEIRIFSGNGWRQQIAGIQDENYYPVLVLACSVILLSMVFRSLMLYYKKPE